MITFALFGSLLKIFFVITVKWLHFKPIRNVYVSVVDYEKEENRDNRKEVRKKSSILVTYVSICRKICVYSMSILPLLSKHRQTQNNNRDRYRRNGNIIFWKLLLVYMECNVR